MVEDRDVGGDQRDDLAVGEQDGQVGAQQLLRRPPRLVVVLEAGVAVLSAEVLPQNHRMIHVFRDSGFLVTTRTLPGVVLVELATSRSSATLERFESRYRVPSHSE